MGDLEFIQEKVIAGDYFQVSGDISTINDTIEFIPENGKTAFILEAKIIPSEHIALPSLPQTQFNSNVIVSDRVKAALKIDGTTKDEANVGVVVNVTHNQNGAGNYFGGGTGSELPHGIFNVKGLSLVGDGLKAIEIENILADGNAFATMSGYFINT